MLQVISKTPVKFRWEDDLAETVVVIQPDDPSEVIMAKLQRVLELEGAALPVAPPVRMISSTEPQFTPADRAAEDARLAGVKVNGWSEDAAAEGGLESLPEV